MPAFDYDLIVIGGGAAGLTASGFGSLMGAKTALVEADRLGGECTWTGCIPSKTLLKASRVAHQIRIADRYGLKALQPEFDFAALMAHVHQVQQQVYESADAPPNMEKLGVEVIAGRARFVDAHAVEIDGKTRISGRYFVIATGSRPAGPSIPGLEPRDYVTNETIFSLTRLPARLAVLGAGPIGIEMAQAYRRLGSEVVVVEKGDRILPHDDPELAGMLRERLEAEGVRFLMKTSVTTARDAMALGDTLLVAIGREARTSDLNLEAASVNHDKSGIAINRRCQTNVKHIYACGDVTGKLQFTHMAEHMAKVAINNAILHLPAKLDERHVPWCTFTDPELAQVGLGETELNKRGMAYRTYSLPFAKIDRAATEGETEGLLKVFASPRRGNVFGVSILGLNAGEMAGEYALAIRNGITLRGIAGTIHAYPTMALGNRQAADQWLLQKRTPNLVHWIQRLFGYRGPIVKLEDQAR